MDIACGVLRLFAQHAVRNIEGGGRRKEIV